MILQDNIMGDNLTALYYVIILRDDITELYHGIISWEYITESCYGIMLRNYITVSYYRIILWNDIMELYHAIVLMQRGPGMPGKPLEPQGTSGVHAGTPFGPQGRPWDPYGCP